MNQKLIFTGERINKLNVDDLPFPDIGYDEMGYEEFMANQHPNYSFWYQDDFPRPYTFVSSRQCPGVCTFCWHYGKFRMRSINNMIAEMKHAIEKYNVNYFYMVDDLWGLTKERLLDFCKKYKEMTKGKNIKWLTSLKVNMVDDEIIQALKGANGYAIGFGLESMSQTVLDSMKKYITPEQIDKAIKLCLKYNINIQGSFIFGDPAETMETAMTTLEYYKNNCQGQPIFEFVKPYPNSPIYQMCLREGLIKDKMDFVRNLTVMGTYVNMTKMSDKEFNKMRNLVMKYQTKCRKSVTPISLEKDKKGFYSLSEKCPYCGHIDHRNNWDIPNRYLYGFTVVCQKCYMRYYIASPLSLILYRNYHLLYRFRIWKDKVIRKMKTRRQNK